MSSTRFPEKALKDLGGKTILTWTLSAMKKVKADAYYVATDEASFSELEPVARSCGWEIFSDPRTPTDGRVRVNRAVDSEIGEFRRPGSGDSRSSGAEVRDVLAHRRRTAALRRAQDRGQGMTRSSLRHSTVLVDPLA